MDDLTASALRVSTLGTTVVYADGHPVPLTRAERTLVAALVAHPRTGAGVDRLITLLWPDGPPPTARQSLNNHISRLRKKLPGMQLVLRHGRYRTTPAPVTDIDQLAGDLVEARDALQAGEAARAAALLPPPGDPTRRHLEDLGEDAGCSAAARAADEQLVDAHLLRAQALVAAGQPGRAVAELEQLVAAHPGRETLWALLVTATAATGRRMDAIATYRRAHRALTSSFGLSPGPELRRLHAELLHVGAEARSRDRRFVGRGGELATCHRVLRTTGQALVVGGAGSGKTALLRQVAAGWRGTTAILACGDNRWHALAPVVGLVEALPGSPDLRPRGVTDARPVPGVDELLHRLRAGVAAASELLVVLDDLDRVGPFSALLLSQVLDRPGVAVLAASRSSDVPVPGRGRRQRALVLDGLPVAAVAELLGDGADAAVTAAQLVGLTAGLPARLHAVLDQLDAAGMTATDLIARPEDVDLPTGLRDALLAVVAGLPTDAREAVEVVAVLDEPVALSRIASLTTAAALDDAVDSGLLRCEADGGIAYSSRLLRRVVYEQIPAGRRQELHCMAWATTDAPLHRRHLRAVRRSLADAVSSLQTAS